MREAARLIIWDLDETFWNGTLTEGGIRFRDDNRDLVIELARRGIVSSICSKNDYETIKKILVEKEVWDYFIFPSISWEPKGPRIAALIEAVQLRPPTVLFIDDNPLNLQEAKHFVPDLEVADQNFIPQISLHPLFKGKDDQQLKRLSQYKLLEKRKADEATAGTDVREFLHSSNIQVQIDFDLIPKIDRAVELINRTNQLNFTKQRLPEDQEEAVAQLRTLLGRHDIQAALIRVVDRYGDHGYCGIYVIQNSVRLLHFAFSCRILGMGVETWLWRRLGRPKLDVVGEVLTDIKNDVRDIDWVNIMTPGAEAAVAKAGSLPITHQIVARGGCDLQSVMHYFSVLASEVIGEFNTNRNGMDARIDHSLFLRHAIDGFEGDRLDAAKGLGYQQQDFQSALFATGEGAKIWLLSFWTDAAYAIYRHRTLGFCLPFAMFGSKDHRSDARLIDCENVRELDSHPRRDAISENLSWLKQNFEYLGPIGDQLFKENLKKILGRASRDTRIFIIEANEYMIDSVGGRRVMPHTVRLNQWTRDVVGAFANVKLINIREFVREEREIHSPFHFDRMVYFRLFKAIEENVRPGLGNVKEAAMPSPEKQGIIADYLDLVGRTDEALALAQREIANGAADPYLHGRIGEIMLRKGDLASAERAFSEGLALNPNLRSFQASLAEVFERQGRNDEAIEIVRSLGDAMEGNPHLCGRLGRLLTSRGDLVGAEAAFRLAIKAEGSATGFHIALAKVVERQGRSEEALGIVVNLAAEGSNDPHVHYCIGDIAYRMGDFSTTEAALRKAIAIDPKMSGAYLLLALALEKLGRAVDAADLLQRRAPEETSDARFHGRLGELLVRMEQWSQAEIALRNAVSIAPTAGDYIVALADVLDRTGQAELGADLLQKAIEGGARDSRIFARMGRVLFLRGSLTHAESAYRKAIEIDPTVDAFRLGLVVVLERQGRAEEAFSIVSKMLATGDSNAHVHARMAVMLSQRGSLPEAEKYYRRAVELSPEVIEFSFGLSDVLVRQSRSAEALAMLQGLTKNHPRNPHLSLRLGYLFVASRDMAGAEASFRAAVKDDPESTVARKALTEFLESQAQVAT